MPHDPARRIRHRRSRHPPLTHGAENDLASATGQITSPEVTPLISDTGVVTASGTITDFTVTTETVNAPPANKSRGTAEPKCKTKTWKAKATVLWATVWSYKVTLKWCYDGTRVYYKSHSVQPDVTTYGSALGWSYDGTYQDLFRDYYTWSEHGNGGYVVRAFPQFKQCLAGTCSMRVFVDVAIRGHYDGTKAGHDRYN